MKGFWTCGPFKEAEDRRERISYNMERHERLMQILESLKDVEKQIASGSIEEKYLGLMMKGDVERDLHIILGIKDDRQEESSEILGKAILESITRTDED